MRLFGFSALDSDILVEPSPILVAPSGAQYNPANMSIRSSLSPGVSRCVPASRRLGTHHRRVHQAAKTNSSTAPYKPSSATDAVENGTKCFEDEQYAEALRLYKAAMDMRPNDDEARAATYNAACVYVKKKQWQPAVDSLKASVNEYGLKVRVIYEVRIRP